MLLPNSIFVSYRRADDAGMVGRLVDRFRAELDHAAFFFDVETINPGEPFPERIVAALASTTLMFVMIGPRWLAHNLPDAHSRLHDPEDYVRFEIETALQNGAHVIPVLFDNCDMPASDQLPELIAPLTERQAFRVSHQTFDSDSQRLIDHVHSIMRQRQSALHNTISTLYRSLGYKVTDLEFPVRYGSGFEAARFVPGVGRQKYLVVCAPSPAITYTEREFLRLLESAKWTPLGSFLRQHHRR